MRFIAGLLVGLLPLGAFLGYQYFSGTTEPCQGRCGAGTQCESGRCVVVAAPSAANPGKRKPRKRSRRRVKHSPDKLLSTSAADRRQVSRGPRLQQTDRIDLARPGVEGGLARELSEGEVTARLRRVDGRILRCIDNARGRHDLGSARVEVSFRIERSGRVSGVRVAAPRLLMRHGLHGCVERVINGLRFPGSGRALVMTYPYSLD